MPTANPLVTTIVPLYNAADTIERTLDSLAAQSLCAREVIVVNDGSTDRGPQIVADLAAKDARIRKIDQPNTGLPGARNTGLQHAKGAYIHFLDADDTIEPTAYERMIATDRAADTGAVVAGHHVIAADGHHISTNTPSRACVRLDDLVDRVGFVCHSPLIRRNLIADLRFDESFRSYEDLDFWFRMGEKGTVWAVCNQPLVTYHMRPGSMSKDMRTMLDAAQNAVENLFERQSALPQNQRRIDASPQRRDARLRHFALSYATQTAMIRSALEPANARTLDTHDAIEMFAAARGDKHITPWEAAEKAHHGFTYALARACDDDLAREAHILEPLVHFWRRCEARGWAEPGLATDALIHLRRVRHEHEMVASRILESLDGARALTIIGVGRNGTVLANLAAAAGFRVAVRDDRLDRDEPIEIPASCTAEPMDAPTRPGEPVVISPLADDTLAVRFAANDGLIRWSRVRADLFAPESLRAA